jgi:tetratricopeptide (TPR) repeat protein
MQAVRFAGGIEETQFGADLLEADYRLKQLAMGLLPVGLPGFATYWDVGMEMAQRQPVASHKISSRFWFYPVSPSVAVRANVVAIQGFKVGVFTEVHSAEIDGKTMPAHGTLRDEAGDQFAQAVSERFDELAHVHTAFARLQGLNELVALTKALEEMDEKPALGFWLRDYEVQVVKTPKVLRALTREEPYAFSGQGGTSQGRRRMSGGVQLMAIALRLHAGDVTALQGAVLATRPHSHALSWNFVVGEWLIPTTPGLLKAEDVVPLFTQAEFLQERGRYDDALTLYGKLIELKSEWSWPYNNRGVLHAKRGAYTQAIADLTTALALNPQWATAYSNRGIVYHDQGRYDQAIAEYTTALERNPTYAEAYNNRGVAYRSQGRYAQALADFATAIELNPKLAEVYTNRGKVYHAQGHYDQAIAEYTTALRLNSTLEEAYTHRGNAYYTQGHYDQAIADHTAALQLTPRLAEAYTNRGNAYQSQGRYDQAIADFTRAIELNPREATAYWNKAFTCERVGRRREAAEAYKGFLQYAPPQYAANVEYARKRLRELGKGAE